MSNKLLYGLLGVLGLGAIGTVVYNGSIEEDCQPKVQTAGGDNDEEEVTLTESDSNTKSESESESLSNNDDNNVDDEDEDDIDLGEIFQINFEDPENLIPKKERKSKLLKTTSPLYSVLTVYRNKLLAEYGDYVSDQRMDFHIELVKKSEEWSEEKLINRAKELEGRCIDLADTDSWNIGRHSVTIKTGRLMGYGNTHITLAYFKEGVPKDVEDILFEIDNETVDDNVEDDNDFLTL
jgi:hypothetical protein